MSLNFSDNSGQKQIISRQYSQEVYNFNFPEIEAPAGGKGVAALASDKSIVDVPVTRGNIPCRHKLEQRTRSQTWAQLILIMKMKFNIDLLELTLVVHLSLKLLKSTMKYKQDRILKFP